MEGISRGTIDALKTLFVVFAFIAVSLRLIANWKYTRRLLVDDYISISAIPFMIALAFAVVISVTTPLTLWTCKAPILFLYLRLFGVKKWLRIISYTTLALTAALYASGATVVPAVCTPHTHDLSMAFINKCQSRTRIINVYLGSVSVLADIVILVLPMPVVFGLQILVKSRIGLIFLFLSGLFAITASIISLYFKVLTLQNPSTSLALPILATITECSVALIVGCVPSMRVLWSKILKPSVKTSLENYATDPTGNRTNRATSQYIVVGEGADGKTSDPSNALVISTEVHTSTSTVADYQQQLQHQTPSGHIYDGRSYFGRHRPDRGAQFGETVQPPFGVYTEAYALQTRHQGVWGR
ncbi:hypothetical protein CHU98_g10250 [Xylaria longipes]|nr:hypothetical protein CHU98_g10250 [Xylaria longipes]